MQSNPRQGRDVSRSTSPPGPKGYPLVGNLPDLASDPLGFLTRCVRDYGDVVCLRLPVRTYLLGHPDHVEHVLLKTHKCFVKARARRRELETLGNGLIVSEGELWRCQRRLMQPSFHRKRVSAYAEVMVDCALQMTGGWKDGQRRDLHRDLVNLTIDIVARTLFAVELTPDQIEDLRRGAETIIAHHDPARLRRLHDYPLHYLPGWIPAPSNLRYRRAQRMVHDVARAIIATRRKTPGENAPADDQDLLGILLNHRDELGNPLPEQQLLDEVVTLFAAGHETTAGALSWAFYLLHENPATEVKLLSELEDVLGGRPPTAEHLPNLPYTLAVVKESLRLYPTNWITRRTSTEDCEIAGYHVPAGTQLIVCQWATHRDGRFFDNPDSFDPDRWLDGRTDALPRYAYFPFSGGSRQCIGKSFAETEATLLLSTIAQHYKPEVHGPVRPYASITLRPAGGLLATIHTRPYPRSPIRPTTDDRRPTNHPAGKAMPARPAPQG